MEDIPESGIFPEIIEGKMYNKFPDKFYTEEWLFALVSLGITFGWSVSGFPPSIELACVCWGVTLVVALHYFWVWATKKKLWKSFKLGIMICIPVFISVFPQGGRLQSRGRALL